MKNESDLQNVRGCATSSTLELTSGITAIANALACRLTTDEIALLSSVLVLLGDMLAAIATQRSLCENKVE